MRTLRIGVLNLSLTIGVSFGVALSGILFQKLGFYGIYSICATMYLMGIIYGLLYIKDRPRNDDAPPIVVCHDGTTTRYAKPSLSTDLKDFFNFQHIRNAFAVTFKKGEDNRRLRIIMMMVVLMIIMGPMTGQ